MAFQSRQSIVNLPLILLLVYLCPFIAGDNAFYKEMPKELRCSGCELTVKVLDQMLIRDTGNTESRVMKALEKVCEEHRFSISEYKPQRIVKVCEFIKKKHGDELKRELVKYFSQSKRSTYLEFVQHFCLDVTRLCAGISHKIKPHEDKEDAILHFDSESHGFTVMPGRNFKMPRPIAEGHDEL
ncbi:uncharacterized protein LOC101851047 [Aplysia californica]|uniref:Uncharacterized protein LOC101851047 n=1 Tax=Aplysia californica TaxID=6500 RepID=A0ABM0JTC5_APLCA|nr:uncharacterized protein LOC101851047 [Aplysia californica]